MTRIFASILSLGMLVLDASVVSGQDYPNKPVHIITLAAGSTNDFIARLIAPGLASGLGQPVIIDNRSVIISLAPIVINAPPDGYTLLSAGSPIWQLPLLQKAPYDPLKDLAPIIMTARSLAVLVVHPSLPVHSVKELIALAKARPGVFNYASGGTGGSGHLTGELFKAMAGVDIVHVPYNGGSAAIVDLIVGQVQMTFDSPSTVMPLVNAGKLRALAVTSAEPSELVPGLPTVAASLPGFESVTDFGVFASAKTSNAIVRRLNQEFDKVLSATGMKEKFLSRGIEITRSSPEQFAATIKSDFSVMGTVIKNAGIQAE